jgi:hypothetical protein
LRLRLFLVVLTAVATAAFAGHGKHGDRNVSISIHDDSRTVRDCSDIEIEFDGDDALRSEEQLQIPSSGTLQVDVAHRGGVRVFGISGSSYQVRLCKAIPSSLAAAADQTFRDIRLVRRGAELTVQGPDGNADWVGYLLIGAPRGSSLQVEATNGPISLQDVSGTFTATAVNGPVSVKDSDGVISARTTNGPISFAGSEGDVKLAAVNGPMSVKLDGVEWRGAGLTASTSNGPLSLKVADGYRSGLEVSGGRGPWSCKSDLCNEMERSEDGRRSLTLGSGTPVVRISTNNGPVSIKSR